MTEERKLATVLFADIVGSSATGAAHDPEVVRRTLSRAFAEMRKALEAHGGTVEKFIGDAVMAVFGVPAAHDDDADRAVRAAFTLRDRIQALNASGRIPLELRIGVNTGQVVSGVDGETLVTGPAVNEAARLQQHAAAGEILSGDLTHRLTAGGVRYGPARTISAKGVGELQAHPAEELTTAVPEQHRGIAGLRAPLVGRDEELRLLVGAYRKTANEKRAALITVFGSAGVGKSRLVREFIELIGTTPVLRGRCLPYGEGITFWPVVEMLRVDARISATDTREEARTKMRGTALGTFPDAGADADAVARRLTVLAGLSSPEQELPDVTGDRLQQELRLGFRRYVERRADREPLVLIFDDIHWAEPPLLDLIEHLAEWSRAKVFLVCIARPELRDRRRGWGGGLMNASAIALEPLTADESRRLIADLLDIDDLPEELRTQVVGRAEGNPLYLEEFLRMLIGSGHIAKRDERWVATSSIRELVLPPTLQGLIAARLDQAPVEVKRMLQRASVIGKVFWTDALTSLDGSTDPEELLLEAARREIVFELDDRGLGGGSAYQFRHILIRDVAYDSIPKEQRARLHDAFGRWLETAAGERLEEYADIVAYHGEQAFLLADELGEPAAGELGRRALALLLARGRKAWRAKDLRAVRSFYARAAQIAERVDASEQDRAEAALFSAMGRAWEETTPEAIDAFRAAVTAARGAGPSVALAESLTQLAYLVVTSTEGAAGEGTELFDEAIGIARASGDHDVIAKALHWRAGIDWWRGELEPHRRQLEEALAYARAHGVTSEIPDILADLAGNAVVQLRPSQAQKFSDEQIRLAEASGSLIDRWTALHARGMRALFGDRAAEAVDHLRALVAFSEPIGIRELVGRANEYLGEALFDAGDAAGSRDALVEALRWYDPRSMRGALPEAQWKLSRAYLALGDVSRAEEQADAGRASVLPDDVYSVASTTCAVAAVRSVQGRVDEADRLFREALAAIGRTDYSEMAVRIRIAYADLLAGQGRAAEARELLLGALELARDPLALRARRRVQEGLLRVEAAKAG